MLTLYLSTNSIHAQYIVHQLNEHPQAVSVYI